MGISLYTSRVVLQILGIEDYGLYNVIGGIVTMFAFLNGSLAGATSRFLTFELGKKDYDKMNKTFNAALITHIAIAVIIIILAETIGLWFFYKKMIIPEDRLNAAFWVYQISILTSFFSLTQVPYNATIIAYEDMKIYAYVGIVEVISRLIIVYLLLISPIDKLVFYALLLCTLQIGVMLYYRFYCRRYNTCSLKLCYDKPLYKNMFSYVGADMIGNIAVLAQGQGLNILLNVFFGPVVNAARAVAYQVQSAITQFSNNFMTAVKPQIIKLYAQGKIEEMMTLVKHSSWFSFYLMLIISLPICLETEYILRLWLVEYPEHTPQFLRLIIILCLIQTLKTPRTTVFHATGHLLLTNLVVGGILCTVFPLAYLLLKLGYSPESVFWAANFTMLASEFASVFILKKYINYSITSYLLNIHLRCFIIAIISTVALYSIVHFMEEGFLRLIITCVFSVVIVSLFAYTLGIDKNVRQKANRFIKKKLSRQ